MGAACAQELAKAGYMVVLMARSEEILSLAHSLGGAWAQRLGNQSG